MPELCELLRLQALRKVPEVNASWNADFIRQYHDIDVSVAVQTPGGLMVPIVHDADALGLSEISAKVKDLATKVGLERERERVSACLLRLTVAHQPGRVLFRCIMVASGRPQMKLS